MVLRIIFPDYYSEPLLFHPHGNGTPQKTNNKIPCPEKNIVLFMVIV